MSPSHPSSKAYHRNRHWNTFFFNTPTQQSPSFDLVFYEPSTTNPSISTSGRLKRKRKRNVNWEIRSRANSRGEEKEGGREMNEKNGSRAKFRGYVIQFAGIISAEGERVSKFYREVGTRGEKREKRADWFIMRNGFREEEATTASVGLD